MQDIDDKKFTLVFWFCVGITSLGLLLLAAIIFIPVPKENQQTANVALGFLTGTMITGAIGYLLGGNPSSKKPDTVVNQTGDNPVTNSPAGIIPIT